MSWLELSVQVDNEAVEAVSELLARYGYNGGVVVEPAWTPGDEGPEFSYDSARPAVLRTYIPLDAQAEDVRQRVAQALWHLGQMRPVGELQTRTLEEEDWANAWKEHYRVLRVGERTVVVPSWLQYEPQPGDVIVQMDPGMAFGTGLHPTTRLCLQALEDRAGRGALGRVLDVGCGSGILSIAAVKLGGTRALGVDIDPVAIEATLANARHNRVGKRVRAHEGSVPSREGPFDTVLANLIAGVLIEIAPDLAAELVPGGTLIGSGIFIDREPATRGALEAAGFSITRRWDESDWVALEAVLPG